MLNAEEALKLTRQAFLEANLERVEKAIKQAAKEGKTSCNLRTTSLSEEAEIALKEGGYKVQVLANCSEIIIGWGVRPKYCED